MTNEEKITTILRKEKERILPVNILQEYEHFSWEKNSGDLAEHCPQYFDTNKYNWEKASWQVAAYCPDKIDPNKFNWKEGGEALIALHPNHKYIKNCIWTKQTIETFKKTINSLHPIWKNYEEQLPDFLNPSKRTILLKRIAKEIAISKI